MEFIDKLTPAVLSCIASDVYAQRWGSKPRMGDVVDSAAVYMLERNMKRRDDFSNKQIAVDMYNIGKQYIGDVYKHTNMLVEWSNIPVIGNNAYVNIGDVRGMYRVLSITYRNKKLKAMGFYDLSLHAVKLAYDRELWRYVNGSKVTDNGFDDKYNNKTEYWYLTACKVVDKYEAMRALLILYGVEVDDKI